MPIIDYTNREVLFRIAVAGPAGAGKTNLLFRLHAAIADGMRGELAARPVGQDQLVSFDCTPPDIEAAGDYAARFHIFTVPGRVADPGIWRRVMRDVDGVLFVADSQFERVGDNADALHAVAELPSMENTPVVFLYNKRDLPNAAGADYLDSVLNRGEPRAPRIESILTTGQGAPAALAAITRLVLDRAARAEQDELESAASQLAVVTGDTAAAPPVEETAITTTTTAPAPQPVAARESDVLTIEGGCYCGVVRFRLRGLPRDVSYCHCADCRRAHAAPLVAWGTWGAADFAITTGTPTERTADGRTRRFCSDCGTQLTFQNEEKPSEVDIAICALDEPELFPPRRHEWTQDILPWLRIVDGLPRY